MARVYFSTKTAQNIETARRSHIRTNLQQIGALRQDPIATEPGIDQSQSESSIGDHVNDVRYVNNANELYDCDEKQVMLTQIFTAFVADAN